MVKIEGRFKGMHYIYLKSYKNKQTVIFIHGLAGNLTIWEEIYPIIGKKFNILMVDLLGHGNSYSPYRIQEYSFASQSKKILNLTKKLKINSFSIISYSYSTQIVFFIINFSPKRINKIIFISPFILKKNMMTSFILKQINFLWKSLIKDKKYNFNYRVIKNYEKPSWKDNYYILKSINTKDYLGSLYSFDHQTSLKNIYKKPILVIYGGEDLSISSFKKKFNNFVNVHILIIKNKKHLFLKTKSLKIANKINTFLTYKTSFRKRVNDQKNNKN